MRESPCPLKVLSDWSKEHEKGKKDRIRGGKREQEDGKGSSGLVAPVVSLEKFASASTRSGILNFIR